MKLYQNIPKAMVDEKELLNENQHNWTLARMGKVGTQGNEGVMGYK